MKRMTFEGHKAARKESAEERKVARANRTATEQLKRLDAAHLTATKERAKLAELIKAGK